MTHKQKMLMMNRWAESLSVAQWQEINPTLTKEECDTYWNKLSVPDRTDLFKVWNKEFGDKALVSTTSIYKN